MSLQDLSISVLKVGRQLAGSLAIAAFFMVFTEGCIAEEKPIEPHPTGNFTTRSIALGSDYRQQVFYNLEHDSLLSQNVKFDWDLSFDATADGATVRLNQAKFMYAWETDEREFDHCRDTLGFAKNRRWDSANHSDSLAIGHVKNTTHIFWIDLGFDENGDPLGFTRVQFLAVTPTKYTIQIASQGSQRAEKIDIQKDMNYNQIHFSLLKQKVVRVEPPKSDWDLQFTQYVFTFANPYTPYLVAGVLTNPLSTQAIADSSLTFSKIDRSMAESLKLSSQTDVIGYDWKAYVGGIYKTRSNVNYIVRDGKGYFYKLRFVDFYDAAGKKGFPKFEVQRL